MRKEALCRAGATCGGALERGDGAALEPLTQLGDALDGVGADAIGAEAAELVAAQAASKGEAGGGLGVGASRAWHESGRYGAAAHLIEVMALPLSPSHSLVMPSVV